MNLLSDAAQIWWEWMRPMFWQAGLLILIVSLIDRLFQDRLWPQVRYALWILVLVKLVIPPTLAMPTSLAYHARPGIDRAIAARAEAPRNAPSLLTAGSGTGEPSTPPASFSAVSPVAAEPARNALPWRVFAFLAWIAGIAVISGLLGVRMRRLRRWHEEQKDKELPAWFHAILVETAGRFNLRRLPSVVFSPRTAAPAVYGIGNPVMLLPARYFDDLSEETARHILLHELAHLKRRDLILHAVSLGLQIIYWFNPLLIWANRQSRHVRELCCDLTVAGVLRERTDAYRKTLLESARAMLTERLEPGMGLLGVFEDPFRLVARLRWLEKKTWMARRRMTGTAVFAGLLFAAVLLPMAGPPPDGRPAASGTTPATEPDRPSVPVGSDPDGLRDRLQAVADAMASEWRTQDLDTLIRHWDEDVVLNGNTTRETRGRAALRKTWAEQNAAGVHILNMNFFVVAAERCGDRILETGTYGVTFRLGKEPEILNDSGKYLSIWKERPDGSLVIIYTMTNTDLQPRL